MQPVLSTALQTRWPDAPRFPWHVESERAAQWRAVEGQESMIGFLRYTWQPTAPLFEGPHTRAITAALDEALAKYEQGISSHLILTVPFRHGKSDLVSRYLPPFFLGRHADGEVIVATYNDDLSHAMSRDSRKIYTSAPYRVLYPDRRLGSKSVKVWSVAGREGKVQSIGMGAGATGKGAHLLVIDDYFKDRAEAESEVTRQSRWEAYTNNLMTRLAPVHIVIILATRWHTDDIIGRCLRRMDPADELYDAQFPRFQVLKFPAISDQYPSGYLFPQRFDAAWYERQRAVLGSYAFAALMQGDPVQRGGAMLKVEAIQWLDGMPVGLNWVRSWDLASTVKERASDDPDYTVGAKVAVYVRPDGLEELYVDDVRWVRAEAPQRDRLIQDTARHDGPTVPQGIEAVAGYKDTLTNLTAILSGVSTVYGIDPVGDKVIRASYIEPIMEAGHVYMRAAPWRKFVTDDLMGFPGGTHDDVTDAITSGYQLAKKVNAIRAGLASALELGAA